MTRELENLLPTLDPPPGGLRHLQQRLAQPPRRIPRRTLGWAGAIALPLLILAIVLPSRLAQRHRTDALTRALQQAMHPDLPANGIRVRNGAALQLPSGQANVRVYLVQTQAPAKPAPTH